VADDSSKICVAASSKDCSGTVRMSMS
jgi:hypothetical protein